ncbi:hypothetical protein ABZ845_24800 [Streptomyces sp. NPDC047022]|uniref:hypothetical protein n=1 Tax=Streptomyces sp. NPDC047022 TaxID=3155737 RepID=UPI00340353C8
MFEYELHQIRSAELIREAEDYRRGREARRARHTDRVAGREPERTGRPHSHRRGTRATRTA